MSTGKNRGRSQMIGLTKETFKDYGKRITDLGGADICYAGPGWTGLGTKVIRKLSVFNFHGKE